MLKNGYIKLHRRMLDWEWYSDIYTFKMFLHLLLTVNISDTKYKGHTIKRGQRVITYPMLCEELGFTIQQSRTALKHLELTGEITVWKTPKFSVVEVKLFHIYQELTVKSTANQQSKSKNLTVNQQSIIDKKNKEEYYDKKVRHGRAYAHAREDGLTDEKNKNDFFVDVKDTAEDRLEIWSGNSGRGVLFMSNSQLERLLDLMPLDIFHHYVEKIVSYTEKKGKPVKDHYGTIRRWYRKDYPKGVIDDV